MPRLQIRLAKLEDADVVATLICSLEAHYADGETYCSPSAARAMVEACMTEREGTRYALAFLEDRPVGLAAFTILRPGFRLTGLLFVKELFIIEQAREQAIGAALMRWLAAYARARWIGRIDLTTDSANRGARGFYEHLGGRQMDKVFYRFNLAEDDILMQDQPASSEEKP